MEKSNFTQPIIGICVADHKSALRILVKRRINHFDGKATFIIFYITDLNFNHLSVKGMYLENKDENWREGTLPFPDVIYLQSRVDLDTVKKIEKVIGKKVFNTFTLDKLFEAQLLAKHRILRKHLPNTQKLVSKIHLKKFLTKHKTIFLKPIYGASSKGVVRLTLHPRGKVEAYFGKNKKMESKNFTSYNNFWRWFSPKFNKNDYLMQQGIQTMKWKDKVTDIRLNMNKNNKGVWEVSVLLFRIARNTSHMNRGPLAVVPMNVLTKFNFSHFKVNSMERAIKRLGYKICNALDASGHHMADLGIDLGFDEKGHLWIFEVNSLPHPIVRIKEDHSLTRPLDYALYLASKN